MHLMMLLLALALAWGLRWQRLKTKGSWTERWQRSLNLFLFPPLLLLTSAIALLLMGPQGKMVTWWDGWISYWIAIAFLGLASILGFKLTAQGWRSWCQIRTYPQFNLKGRSIRLLPTPIPFIAQVGFWQSELIVTQGLLDTFDSEHLEAVLTHEQAHYHYHDTFWFFWLGWLRRFSAWLPQTETLWQELLVLREIRADRWAARRVDNLLLAESLVQMVRFPDLYSENFYTPFSCAAPRNRLEERIEALLSGSESPGALSLWFWIWLLLVFLPLAIVPFHY
jgi:Zn-dependent protease with chaperone function